MSQNTIIGIVLALVVIVVGGFLLTRKAAAPSPAPEGQQVNSGTFDAAAGIAPSSMQEGETAAPAEAPAPVVVTYSDSGFSPSNVTVAKGTTVRFVNNSSRQLWVGAAMHPTHTQYDGTTLEQHCTGGTSTSFDQCKAEAPGTVYSFTFDKAGTFGYHNHVQASHFGRVTVTE